MFPVLCGLVLCVPFLTTQAQDGLPPDAPALSEDSPFLPPDFSVPSTAQPEAGPPPVDARFVEFKGVYELGGTYFFNIFDKRENKSAWVRMNDRTADFLVTAFHPEDDAISIYLNGKTTRLAMQQRTHTPMAVEGAPSAAPPPERPIATTAADRRNPDVETVTRRRVVRPPVRRSTSGDDDSPVTRRVPVPRRR